ncbi:hypothetical protein [Pseudomonas sp. NMI760_13]|uniref:hypothetical protein n=1 Tax=Pseudomonas sp. NMI760_13 TaxID=2903147 RepID=UPI001E2F0E23|nr:hypothetical protein [Pseudomonas sp. NMI760_13]MCE0914600.1 hypothetical protein [Pseudomonas sp. NMI760_13]
MSPITSALRLTPIQTPPAPAQNLIVRQPASVASAPGTQVSLGQDTRIPDSETYTSRGTLDSAQPSYTWEQDGLDKLSMYMFSAVKSSTTAARFQGLGSALVEQLAANGGQRVSQSALQLNETDTTALSLQQARLREFASNTVTLSLTTASGATVKLGLYNGERGLAVDAEVQGGELNANELKGLAALADGFQSAINGLTRQPPSLQLGALVKLDPSLFSGLQMNAKLDLPSGGQQTFDLRLDGSTRSLKLDGPSGQVQLDLDSQGGALLGGKAQRQAALDNYLTQFDDAQKRGKGDAQLTSLLKDAFSQLNSIDDNSPRPAGHNDAVNTYSRALLSGLADFKASIVQPSSRLNARRLDEEDRFAYQVSQSTSTSGQGTTIARQQRQEAKLDAAWHSSLSSAAKLTEADPFDEKNYRYHTLSETASSTTELAFVDNVLKEAKATQEATSTKRVLTYEGGKLESDVSTPESVSRSRNLLNLLDDLFKTDEKARRNGSPYDLDAQLAAHAGLWQLQTDPAKIHD